MMILAQLTFIAPHLHPHVHPRALRPEGETMAAIVLASRMKGRFEQEDGGC